MYLNTDICNCVLNVKTACHSTVCHKVMDNVTDVASRRALDGSGMHRQTRL